VQNTSLECLVFSILWRVCGEVAYLCYDIHVEGLQRVAVFQVVFGDSLASELRFYLLEPYRWLSCDEPGSLDARVLCFLVLSVVVRHRRCVLLVMITVNDGILCSLSDDVLCPWPSVVSASAIFLHLRDLLNHVGVTRCGGAVDGDYT